MTSLPTTGAMVEAAQDAYDVAEADRQVAFAKYIDACRALPARPTPDHGQRVADADEARARWLVAEAARDYAWAVLGAVRAEHHDRAVPA